MHTSGLCFRRRLGSFQERQDKNKSHATNLSEVIRTVAVTVAKRWERWVDAAPSRFSDLQRCRTSVRDKTKALSSTPLVLGHIILHTLLPNSNDDQNDD